VKVVLLQIAPAGAASVVDRLAANGIAAEVVDHPSTFVLWLSCGTYRVRVAVEEADEPRAHAVLEAWSEEARPRIAELARAVRLDALVALVPALAVGALLLLGGPMAWLAAIVAVPAAWLGAMVLLGRRRRRAGPPA
jgi:hypothetical protein